MVVVNPSGEIVLLNDQAEKQFGHLRGELRGQKVEGIIPQGLAERLIAEATSQRTGGGIELNGQREDGTEFPIEIVLNPFETAEGILVKPAIREITERKDSGEAPCADGSQVSRAIGGCAGCDRGSEREPELIALLNVQAEKQFGKRRNGSPGAAGEEHYSRLFARG